MDAYDPLTLFDLPDELLLLILEFAPECLGLASETCRRLNRLARCLNHGVPFRTVLSQQRITVPLVKYIRQSGHLTQQSVIDQCAAHASPRELSAALEVGKQQPSVTSLNRVLYAYRITMQNAAWCMGQGATDVDCAMCVSAGHGNLVSMRTYREQGATYIDETMFEAADNGQLGAMRLCKEWGARNFDWALIYAAGGGHLAAMRLCKKWGATNFDLARQEAYVCGQLAAMRLCEEWSS